jgi:hypothetical protein
VLPDESGLDDAPKYEPVFGVRTHDRLGYYHALWRARRHRYPASAIVAAYDDHVEDVLVNVLYARGLLALGGRFAERADRVRERPLERSWDPGRACSGTSPAALSARCGSPPGRRWRRWPCRVCRRR